jgi:hypothetical protein
MSKVTIRHNQSVLDLSIQPFGTLEALMEMAFVNDISVTDELIEGDELELANFQNGQIEIMAFYAKHNIKPATGLTNADFVIVENESCNLCNCFK